MPDYIIDDLAEQFEYFTDLKDAKDRAEVWAEEDHTEVDIYIKIGTVRIKQEVQYEYVEVEDDTENEDLPEADSNSPEPNPEPMAYPPTGEI